MADSKISALTDGSPLQVGDELVVARGGADLRISARPWTIGTNPPASPQDGDVWILPADATNGVDWMFIYNSAETTYKWRFIGGPPMFETGSPSVIVNAATPVTAGYYYDPSSMSVTVPRAGDYLIRGQATIFSNGGGASFVEAQVFTGAPSVTLSGRTQSGIWDNAVNAVNGMPVGNKVSGVAAGTVVGICVDTGNNGTYKLFDTQWVEVTPVRVI